MKSFEDFSESVVDLYDAIQAAVEHVEDNQDVTYPEIMCVLSSLLCNAAVEVGMSREEFMITMRLNFDHADNSSVPASEIVH